MGKLSETNKRILILNAVLLVDIVDGIKRNGEKGIGFSTKYPQKIIHRIRFFSVDIVNNYFCNRFSPIFTTSPAPIVINRSSFVQFFKRKFSIASKEGK